MSKLSSDIWKKLNIEPLSKILQLTPDNKYEARLPSLVATKYTDDITLNTVFGDHEQINVQEIISKSPRSKIGYLLDLICENILPQEEAKPTSTGENTDNSGFTIVVDCGYKWVDANMLSHKLAPENFEHGVFPPNSLYMKLLVNMNAFGKLTSEQKIENLRKLLIIDAYDSSLSLSLTSVKDTLKKMLSSFEEYVPGCGTDLSKPLKCIIIDNIELLYWEIRDSQQTTAKLKELYSLLLQISKSLRCRVLVSRLDYGYSNTPKKSS